MSYNDKNIIRDLGDLPVPQYFNEALNQYEPVKGFQGATFVYVIGSPVENFTFHNGTTEISIGSEINLSSQRNATISISGSEDNTAREIVFEEKDIDGNWRSIVGVRRSSADMQVATQTTGIDETWQLDITGSKGLRIGVASITGGTLTIKGVFV